MRAERTGVQRRAWLGAVIGALLLASGCGEAASLGQAVQPRDGRAGLQVTGQLGGRQLSLSQGAPQLVVGDCDPGAGVESDNDVCAITADVDGTLFVLSLENPAVLEPGASLPIGDPDCVPAECDEVTDVAIVDVQSGIGDRRRATDGLLEIETVEPFQRYVGRAELDFPNGSLSAEFDLVPRADE